MDNTTYQLLNLLFTKCNNKDKSNNTFYYLLDILLKLNIIELEELENKNIVKFQNKQNNNLIVKTNNITNILSLSNRYNQDFNELIEIGKGGFGIVYLSENKIDMVKYAIKKIYLNIEDSNNINLSLNEIYILFSSLKTI